ncbi:MAG: hypothetical protein ACPG4U_08075 [Pseudomonadales bacterium]
MLNQLDHSHPVNERAYMPDAFAISLPKFKDKPTVQAVNDCRKTVVEAAPKKPDSQCFDFVGVAG